MPVLAIALISLAVLAFLSAGIAHWYDHRHQEQELVWDDPGTGERFSTVPPLSAFAPDYALLWETQVPALKLVASAGENGLSIYRLSAWYLNSSRRYPELYEGSSFQQWLEFLMGEHLLARTGSAIALTVEGAHFLRYLTSRCDLRRYSDRKTPSAM